MTARGRSVAALVATCAASAALVVGAFVTVESAGCADAGRVVTSPDGTMSLVGGCVAADDLVVPGSPLPVQPPDPSSAGDVRRP